MKHECQKRGKEDRLTDPGSYVTIQKDFAAILEATDKNRATWSEESLLARHPIYPTRHGRDDGKIRIAIQKIPIPKEPHSYFVFFILEKNPE